MKLKKYKKRTIGSYLSMEIIIIIISIIFSLIVINYYSKKFNQVFMPIGEANVRKYITKVINNATEGIKFDSNLFVIEKNNNNEIKMINYNSYEATKLINDITNNIQNKLDMLEVDNRDSYIVCSIPFGVIFNNLLLRNMGPKVNIRTSIMGDVLSELQTEVKPYGINNALVEVRVSIVAKALVILPLSSKEIEVTNMIPISINIVNGSIPEAYISTYK